MQRDLKETVSGVVRIENAISETTSAGLHSMKSITGEVADVRRELALLRSSLNFTDSMLNRQSDMDRGQMGIKLDTMDEYLSKTKSTGGHTTDQEMWEMVWDFIEAYRVVGDELFISGSHLLERSIF
jgi:hypothetical protein